MKTIELIIKYGIPPLLLLLVDTREQSPLVFNHTCRASHEDMPC